MSENVGIAGYSIELNAEDQNENSLKEIAKSLGYEFENNLEWDDIMYSDHGYMRRWKPHMDDNGIYGFIYQTFYKYECYDIENYVDITEFGKVLKDFIDKTHIVPKEKVRSFTIFYYNGSESPFKF